MSEKDKKPLNPLGKPGLNKSGKPKFSSYWIVGIILLVLLGVQFLNNSGTIAETDSNAFFEMLKDGDVEKFVIVNKEKIEIYIKSEKLADAKYNDLKDKRNSTVLGQSVPQYTFTIVFPEVFGQELNTVMNDLPDDKKPAYTTATRKNVLGEMLVWVFPFLLILGIWIFMLQFIISKGKWIGGGDIRLGFLMGTMLGWPNSLVALLLAYIVGSVISIFLIVFKFKKWGDQLPFGTFLTLATVISLLYGTQILNWYLGYL